MMFVIITVVMVFMAIMIAVMLIKRLIGSIKPVLAFRSRSLNYFVELSAIEPDSAAFRAVINFDALLVGYDEGHVANWTVHVNDDLSD
jgi:hypothetical protein